MAKTTPEHQAWREGFDVGAEHVRTAIAGRGRHPVFALALPEDKTLRWHWLSGYSVGFQVELYEAVTIRETRPPRRRPRPPLPAQEAGR